jgi:hypothetical protein
MKLSDREKRMLDGEAGEAIRKAMEVLRAVGEIYDARGFAPIRTAHIGGLSIKTLGDAGLQLVEEFQSEGAKVVVPTTLNVIGVDRWKWRSLGLPEEWARQQLRVVTAYEKMGCDSTCSCCPYYHGCLPKFGEHVAWAESSAVVFVNSILGARDNREGFTAFASALTGLTPLYGLHLPENRKGHCRFRLEVMPEGLHEWGALGAYVGRKIGDKIPVFENVPPVDTETLVSFGAALAATGAVPMFHIVGTTPEARTIEEAFGGVPPAAEVLTAREIKEGTEQLTSATSREVDYVAVGCPHFTLRQIAEVAHLLNGKRVSESVVLWVHTALPIFSVAEKLGYVQTIERAGGRVTVDVCTILGNPEALGVKTLATNSAKMAFYAPGSNHLKVWFGSLKNCIQAAITGKWKGT